MPATAPVVPTQTNLFFHDAATVLGNSPGIAAVASMGVKSVGSWADMVIMERVLDPAFTANILCYALVVQS